MEDVVEAHKRGDRAVNTNIATGDDNILTRCDGRPSEEGKVEAHVRCGSPVGGTMARVSIMARANVRGVRGRIRSNSASGSGTYCGQRHAARQFAGGTVDDVTVDESPTWVVSGYANGGVGCDEAEVIGVGESPRH